MITAIVDRLYSPELKKSSCFYMHCPYFLGIWHILFLFCYFELFFYHYLQEAALACRR